MGCFCVLGADLDCIAWANGGCTGMQSVPRAELYAFVWIIEHTAGNIIVAIDAHYVIKGFRKGCKGAHSCHQDLWRRLWEAISRRPGIVQVVWVKSHLTLETAQAAGVEPWAFIANWIADDLAEEAAKRVALPFHVYEPVNTAESLAWKIRQRLIGVFLAWAALERPPNERLELVARVPKRRVVEELLENTRHQVKWVGLSLLCMCCNTGINFGKHVLEIEQWVMSSCVQVHARPQDARVEVAGVHPSHKLAFYRGLHFCTACGNLKAVVCRYLANECVGAVAAPIVVTKF